MLQKYGGHCFLVVALLVLTLMQLSAGQAQAASQYNYDCSFCHTMPPMDSGTAKKDPSTGAVPGNHAGHATSAVNSCVTCHGSQVSAYAMAHRNKTIELSDAVGYSRKIAAGFVNQTSVPPTPMGSCSTVACHSNGKGTLRATPAWGSAALTVPGGCSACHDVAPSTGNHPTAGSKHANYYGTGVGSCVQCHTDHSVQAKPFSHATSAGHRSIEVKFATGGSFASNQCSNVYCHSNGRGTYTPPTWGGSLTCAGCHGDATSNTLSGNHAKHVNNAAFLGTNYGCVECHSSTVSNDSTISNFTNHVNTTKDVAGSKVGTPVSGTCSTSYCHSDGKGTMKSVTWTGSTALTCKSCHGADAAPAFASKAGEPNYANAGATQLRANSHLNHVASAADCVSCHADTTVDGTTIKAGTFHTNNTRDLKAGNGKGFTVVAGACSAVSCHSGNGIVANVADVKWGASLGCNGCHGNASSLVTNAHAAHVSTKGYTCDTCHAATVSGNTFFVNKALHGDATVEVAGANVTTWSGTTTKTCATSCHLSATPQWNVPASGACGTCHTALSNTTGGLISSNAHSQHFTAAYGPGFNSTLTTSCSNCHTSNTASTHADGTLNLAAGSNKIGTCSTCHQQSTNWTTGRVTCESCHSTAGGALSVIGGITAPDKTSAATTGHGKAGIAQACSACHDNTAAHISGVLGDQKRLLSTLVGATNQECDYCHTNAAKVSGSKLNVRAHQATGLGAKCSDCHNAHGTTNSMMVNATINSTTVSFTGNNTFANAGQTGVCQVCHTTTKYFTKAGVPADAHVDSTTDCTQCHAHNPATGLAFVPNGGCDACHGYPPAPRQTLSAVTFGVQGNWSSARFEDYSGGGGAHLVLAHIKKDAKPSEGWANCLPCHKGGDATHARALPIRTHVTSVSVDIDPQYRFSDQALVTYTSAALVNGGTNKSGSCFNVSCHFKPSPKWSIER
ncbi:CxxxxCH/CxxCH domain c-type cytochrome [Geomonas propionica]|uniref:CxxxxCH/CxxCH domain-containing protein n=1 Tax=Geomonas propionica TaxID=2798582 RepID=A0ABS0YXP1_9BACT|nr:CxxxxCH/CxxCH domain-containing protein [Geomonas propionica]MBJ6802737.1 CxxxxCH/CxxCH domain-containing protein [Geomonas propionica]